VGATRCTRHPPPYVLEACWRPLIISLLLTRLHDGGAADERAGAAATWGGLWKLYTVCTWTLLAAPALD
jgi:hypothetical protein